jgi:CPA1 family monovalent cation:H+ antiporter
LNPGVIVLLILLIGSITSILSKRFKITYAKLLVVVGLVISVVYQALGRPAAGVSGELIINVILPPLIFQAALTMNYAVFKKVQKPVISLAIVGVAVSAIACSLIVSSLTNLTLVAALAFGVIIAPTDAASVISTLKQLKAPKELSTIIEGEALLNDATTLALFSAVSALTLNPLLNVVEIAIEFGGGLIVGLVIAFLATKLISLLSDRNARVMVTISEAYGSYMLADALGFSGIVAVAILGLYMGRYYQQASPNDSGNDLMIGFWDVASLIANTVAFTFIGLTAEVPYLLQYAPLILLAFAAVLVARYISVEAVLVPAAKFIGKIPRTWRNITTLGGIRGAVSAALALALPEFPFKKVIVAITFGVILLSLLVQTWLLSYYSKKAHV